MRVPVYRLSFAVENALLEPINDRRGLPRERLAHPSSGNLRSPAADKPVDKARREWLVGRLTIFMSSTPTPEPTQHSLTPENFPFTAPQLMSRYVTDTGKILPRKYTGLSASQQRAVTKTIKNSRNLLLAK